MKEALYKQREVSGIILDRKIPLKSRMKVQKYNETSPLYGTETWHSKKKDEDILERTEMVMVRWIAGISLLERRESINIRRMCGVCNIREKATEARLRYFGYVKRKDEEEPVKKAMIMPVTGRSVGRQVKRWKDVVERDIHELGLQEEEALDRSRWKKITREADPATQWE